MFTIAEMSDVVKIPPNRQGTSLKETSISILKEKYESMISADLGYVIMIIDADINAIGKLISGDGATYHRISFKALTFYPTLQEIVEGEVVEITEFGAFVRIGPTDALLHLSQILDEYLRSDLKQGMIIANNSSKTLKIGSRLRARVTAVSLSKGAAMGKIGITCRQPFLGTEEWIQTEVKKAEDVQPQKKEKVKKEVS